MGANGLVEGGEYGDPTLELLIGADTTISHDEAAKLLAIDTIVLSQDDADVSLSATSFSSGTSTTHFRELAGITSSSNNTTTFADDVGETGSTFDLTQISSISGLNSVTINGDTGANVITLSQALSDSGKVTFNLGSDTAVDKLILKVGMSNYTNVDDATLSYNVINDFDPSRDKFNVLYSGTDDALADSNSYLVTSDDANEVAALSNDRSVVEEDSVRPTTAGTDSFDTVSEVQTLIANSITTVPDNDTDKVINIFYGYNTSTSATDGFIVASRVNGARPTDDLQAGDNFSVLSLAQIVAINRGDPRKAHSIPDEQSTKLFKTVNLR